ncbi:hypothetical protein NBRC116494_17870 [Aurantivibrio plasticivorans]
MEDTNRNNKKSFVTIRSALLRIVVSLLIFISSPVHAQEPYKIISNVKSFRELEGVQEKPIDRNVYDLSFSAYDQVFAEEFGLKAEKVTELDTGLRFIEIRMITEGTHTNCYYNVVLDKSVKLDFPEEDYEAPSMSVFPPQVVTRSAISRPAKVTEDQNKQFTDWHKNRLILLYDKENGKARNYRNRTYLGNLDYKFNTSGKPFSNGHAFDVHLIAYVFSRSQDYTIISTKRPCGGGNIYNYPKPSFWVRKNTSAQITNLPRKSDHHIFTIPNSIVESFKPILFEYESTTRRNRNK